jgi:hypothetical protein
VALAPSDRPGDGALTGQRRPARDLLVAAAIAVVVALASAGPRIALSAGALPDAARSFLWADLLYMYDHLAGRAPYWEVPFYYPPLIGYVAAVLAKLTASPATFVLAWSLLVAAAAGAVAALLVRAAGARATVAYWAATPQLLLFAGVNFDALAVLFVVAAVQLARDGRAIAALAMLAVGTNVKVFPAALVPVQLDKLRPDLARAIVGTAVFAGIVMAVALPSLLAPWPVTFTVPDYARRVTSESVWGLLQAILAAVSLESVVRPIAFAGLVATYALGVVPAARRAADPAIGAGLALVTVLLWTPLYQPQYSLWVVPFFALLRIPWRWYAVLGVADVLVFATFMLLTYWLVGWDGRAQAPEAILGVLTAVVVLRHVALIGTWLALYRIPQSAGAAAK